MTTISSPELSSFLPRDEFFSQSSISDPDSPNSSSSTLSPPRESGASPPLPCAEISQNYKTLIDKEKIRRRSLEYKEDIKCLDELINWKFENGESFVTTVFGVVKSVRHSSATKFKYVTIIDPTNDKGIELETFGTQIKIAVGQMIKVSFLKVQRTGSSAAFLFTPSTKTLFFPLFSYNYDNPMGDERNKALTETRFNSPADRDVCRLLEQWFSLKILNGNQLCNLPSPGAFVDICCQVLAFNRSPCCINAIIWDTTKPKYTPFFGSDGRLPQGLESINYDYFQVAYERYFPLNIWKEESNDQAQHYDTFRCVDLTTADDLVVMFNLQVVEDHNHPGNVSLVMRSSRKWGKAVRLCHRNSILGKMFLKKCQDYKQIFRKKLDLIDLVENSPKSPKKQKTNEEALISKTNNQSTINNKSALDPKPSTSRYALRSQTRIAATEPSENGLQNHEKSAKKTEDNSLTHLLNKSKGILDWDALLSNGLDGLNLLKETLEEELALNESFPLTRIEYLQLIKLTIEHLQAQ